MNQELKIDQLIVPATGKELKSQWALARYIGVSRMPDVCAPVQHITPGHGTVSPEQCKSMKKTVDYMKKTRSQELHFVAIDMSAVRAVVLPDASFANASE